MATAVRMVTESGVAHLEPDPNDVATRGGKVSELDGMSAEYAMRALAGHQRLIIDGQEYEFYGLRLTPVGGFDSCNSTSRAPSATIYT